MIDDEYPSPPYYRGVASGMPDVDFSAGEYLRRSAQTPAQPAVAVADGRTGAGETVERGEAQGGAEGDVVEMRPGVDYGPLSKADLDGIYAIVDMPSREGFDFAEVMDDEAVALGPHQDPIMRALDRLWGGALDTANSRDFRTFAPDEERVDGGGTLDEGAYIRVKAARMRHAYGEVTAERDQLRAAVERVRGLCALRRANRSAELETRAELTPGWHIAGAELEMSEKILALLDGEAE